MIHRPDQREISDVARQLGFAGEDADLYAPLVEATLDAYDTVAALPDDPADREPVPLTSTTEADDPDHAWLVRAEIHEPGAAGALTGRTIAVKDNIMVAGLPMTNGAHLLDGYLPRHDATVVRRVLVAGATIVGKTNCEYLCLSGGSHTSDYGAVHNPRRRGYTSGGSSSGNAVAVVRGHADMAIGCDQAGSIRVPASYSGLVGLKPTHGLVPYTGIAPLEPTIDHVGPMTATVADAATLLSVIAGYDDYDPRQRRITTADYSADLDRGVDGLRIGVLREGFGTGDPAVDGAVRQAATDLARLGAVVEDVSIPLHTSALAIWTPLVMQGTRDVVLAGDGFGTGRTDRYPIDYMTRLHERADRRHEMPPNVVACAITAELVNRHHGAIPYGMAVNAVRRLRAAYDRQLHDHDALLMPTTPTTAPALPPRDAPLGDSVRSTNDMFANTAGFNATHHPSLSIPCGEHDALPIGLMFVGRHYDEATVLRIGHAYETR